MRENLTQAIEDYLKTIYEITCQPSGQIDASCTRRATTNQIADALGVTPASVTGMLKKLSETDPPLVEYQKHRGVVLTFEGEQAALEILRHHRLLESFLHQILGYKWHEVHVEADRLEHVISEEFEERIATALGDPTHDPHGDPIPTRELQMPITSSTLLANLRTGQSAVIVRVDNKDPAFLCHLEKLGLIPGTRLTIQSFSPFDHNLGLLIADQARSIVLGPSITQQVFVQVIE